MKNDNKWYATKAWIIRHSIFALLFLAIAAYGYAWGVGVGIGGGKGGSPLIGVFVIGGTLSALYCFIMSIIGLFKFFKNNETNSKGNIIILRSLAVLSIIGSLQFGSGILSIFSRLSYMTILEFAFTFSSLGTLLGAILMFFRKKKGLYIYSLFQLAHIISLLSGLFYYFDLFTLLLSFFTVIFPNALFLALYWSKQIRQNLT